MTQPCYCDDPTSICPTHAPPVERVTVADIMAGCQCHVDDWLGQISVTVAVTCPVHGAPAFRKEKGV